MTISDQFAATYAEARGKFLDACEAAGATVTSHRNPAAGPNGTDLTTDVARLGSDNVERVVVAVSGTHGVEGFCGSGVQVGLLRDGQAAPRPSDVALLLVHAINPYGFSWLRRVTEDNIDLNRNFVDHAAKDYPDNPGYDVLAKALVPPTWDAQGRAAAEQELDAYAKEHGLFGLQAAITVGQYRHPDGLFYGGQAPTWSRRTIEDIVTKELASARQVALIDFHTGLGPYGYGEPIATHPPESDGLERARAWFGPDVTSPEGGSSTSAVVRGDLARGLTAYAPHIHWTGIALEFGTKPVPDVLDALRGDAWLHKHGDLDSAEGKVIKAEIRDAFYGDEPSWKSKIWERGVEMVDRAYRGLTSS